MVNEQIATTQALNQAMQMEIDGKGFYLAQSQGSTNLIGKKLFKILSEEEDSHLKKFEIIFDKYVIYKRKETQIEFQRLFVSIVHTTLLGNKKY